MTTLTEAIARVREQLTGVYPHEDIDLYYVGLICDAAERGATECQPTWGELRAPSASTPNLDNVSEGEPWYADQDKSEVEAMALDLEGCAHPLGYQGKVFYRWQELLRPAAAMLRDLKRQRDEAKQLSARFKQEAQMHAQEARTANHTIAEIYQVCSGGTGEKGNWNGAEPVRQLRTQLAAANAALAEAQRDAERYRWLREQAWDEVGAAEWYAESEFDAFIDAAIAKGQA